MDEADAQGERGLLNCLLGRGLVSQSILQRFQNVGEPEKLLFIGVCHDFDPRDSSYHGQPVRVP